MCGIFVGFPDDSAGWIFYVPSVKRSYTSLDATFDESFTSPLALPDLPYQGAIRLQHFPNHSPNQETLTKHTCELLGENETFPVDIGLPNPTRENITANISDLVTRPTRRHKYESSNLIIDMTEDNTISHENDTKIRALFTNMKRGTDSINFAEYLNRAHEQVMQTKDEIKINDTQINLSDFIPEPKSINQVLKQSTHIKDKWGAAIQQEITGLFDNDTFDINEKALLANEVIPVSVLSRQN